MAVVRKRTWESKGTTQTAWLVDYRDRQGRRRFETFRLKKQADARLTDIQTELKAGTHTPVSTSITLREGGEVWYRHCEARKLERATLKNYRRHLDLHLNLVLGRTKLSQLTTPGIAGFRDDLLRKTGLVTARKVIGCLKSILTQAQERGLVAHNSALAITFKATKRDKKRLEVGIDIPTPQEVRLLIDHAAAGRWRAFFVTAVFTGLRASELRGLRWSDVDLDKRVLHVRQRADRWNTIGLPKSKAGQRTIPLTPFLVNTLREWKIARPKSDLDLAFPSSAGTPLMHSNICNGVFYPLQIKAGLTGENGDAKYNLHSLRHFAASFWIDQNFPPKRIQSWMGHASITMTYDTYGHLMPSDEDDHAKLALGELSIVG